MQAYSVQTYSVQAYSVDASGVPGLEDGDAAEACLLQEDVDHPRGLVRSSRGGLPVDPHLRLPPGGADVAGVLCLKGRVRGVLGSSNPGYLGDILLLLLVDELVFLPLLALVHEQCLGAWSISGIRVC